MLSEHCAKTLLKIISPLVITEELDVWRTMQYYSHSLSSMLQDTQTFVFFSVLHFEVYVMFYMYTKECMPYML